RRAEAEARGGSRAREEPRGDEDRGAPGSGVERRLRPCGLVAGDPAAEHEQRVDQEHDLSVMHGDLRGRDSLSARGLDDPGPGSILGKRAPCAFRAVRLSFPVRQPPSSGGLSMKTPAWGTRAAWRGLALAALAVSLPIVLGTTGCPEAPITEKVEFRFLPEGTVVVTTNVAYGSDDDYRDNPAVLGRLQEARQNALDGRDVWVQRYASLNADAEQIRLDKEKGNLARVSHRAHVKNPENLGRFFSDSPIVVNYSAGDGSAELAIYPGGPWRATQDEQTRLAKVFDEWTRDVARYLKATRRLYEYLERNPSRARVCIGNVFEDLLPKETRANLEPPRMPDEDEMVSDVHDGLSSV